MPKKELYIGNLNKEVSRRDIESVFDKYGRLVRCDIKDRGHGPVYAFLEYEDERDAEDALKSENGKDMCGASMVIEYAKEKGRGRNEFGRGRNSFGGGGGGAAGRRDNNCFNCGRPGHFARDCDRSRRDRSRSRSRDRRRRSRTRSRDRRDRSRSRDRSRDRRDRRRSRSRS